MLLNLISVFLGTLCFAITFHVPRRHLMICGAIGTISWWVYSALNTYGTSQVFSTFIGALTVSISSYFCAKLRHAPATVFLIPSIIPLVPGLGLYQTMYALLTKNYGAAITSAILTFQLSGVIAGAIIISAFLPIVMRKLFPKNTLKKSFKTKE